MAEHGARKDRQRRLRGNTIFAAVLPGALAGTQLAGLLFFLNPHLPFEGGTILRGVSFFSTLLGIAGCVALVLLSRGRGARIRRWLPWSLTFVLAAASTSAWVHASFYAFYLPSGINRRLIKAGIWLGLAAFICFYIALAHGLQRRPYGRRSRTVITLVALATVYVVLERRDAFKPRLEPAPRPTTFAGTAPQLIVVGIEAATLDVVLPLAEQGQLPFFSRILAEGASARMQTLEPVRRLPLWTSLATGKMPFEHKVVDQRTYGAAYLGLNTNLRLLPIGVGFRQWAVLGDQKVTTDARQTLALWEILSRLGLRTALVGWPLISEDAEPAASVGLSEDFFTGDNGLAWPTEVAERARLFQPPEIGPEESAPFGPDPPGVLLDAVAADLWRQDLSYFLLDQYEIDAFFVLLPGLREVSREFFGGYSAVRFEGVQEKELAEAEQFIEAYYARLDEFLARLWERGRDSRLLVVVSVHGTEDLPSWQKAWSMLSGQSQRRGSFSGAPDGLLALMGEGVQGTRLGLAQLVDMMPTLLYGLGFPVARDLEGAVLTDAFDTGFLARRPLTFLPSYETFTGNLEGREP